MIDKINVTLPQANSIELLFSIFLSCKDSGSIIEKIAFENNITTRTAKYYLDALIFLDFIAKSKKIYIWKSKLLFLSLEENFTITDFKEMMLVSKNLREIAFKYIIEQKKISSLYQFLGEKYNISGSTLVRRGQCLDIWFSQLL